MGADEQRRRTSEKDNIDGIVYNIDKDVIKLKNRIENYSITEKIEIFNSIEESLKKIPDYEFFMTTYYPYKFPKESERNVSQKEFDDFKNMISKMMALWDERIISFIKKNTSQ